MYRRRARGSVEVHEDPPIMSKKTLKKRLASTLSEVPRTHPLDHVPFSHLHAY